MHDLDPRIVEVSIQVDNNIKTYTDIQLSANGMKYANANQNEAEIKLTNIDKLTADYLLTETSPYNLNRTPKKVTVRAGRVSYGTTQIFVGDIVRATISQPPDVIVSIKSLTANFMKGKIISRNQAGTADLSVISQQVANDLGVTLNYQAKTKKISNYTYSGAALKQVNSLNDTGDVDAYIDDGTLVVKDANVPIVNVSRILDLDSGMVGIPELTEQGVKVKYLLDNVSVLGGTLDIRSIMYPAVNGKYIIYKLGFEISNRDTPFYWIAEAKRRQ